MNKDLKLLGIEVAGVMIGLFLLGVLFYYGAIPKAMRDKLNEGA